MKKLHSLLFLLFLITSCSDNETTPQDPEPLDTIVKEEVLVINHNESDLASTSEQLANGVYIFTYNGNLPEIVIGDILIGEEGEGYLRKVVNVSVDGNTITTETVQATLEDVFEQATISIDTDISNTSRMSNSNGKTSGVKVNYAAEGVRVSDDGWTYNFSNTELFNDGPLSLKVTNGSATFTPNFRFDTDYENGSATFMEFKTENSNFNINCNLLLNASSSHTFSGEEEIVDTDKTINVLVGGIPVPVVINVKLVASLSGTIDAEFNATSGFNNDYTLNAGVKYDGSWSNNFSMNQNFNAYPLEMEGVVGLSQNLTITPRVSLKFYGVVGPYCEPEVTEDFALNVASPSLDWDSNVDVGMNLKLGVDIEVFSTTLVDVNDVISYQETIWNAPNSITKISGDEQEGSQGSQLTEPLKVVVKDNLDNTFANVPVYFEVTQGGGSVSDASVMTNDNGIAEVYWTLGNESIDQTVSVSVKKADGSSVTTEAILFTATGEELDFDINGTWTTTYLTNNCSGPGTDSTYFNNRDILFTSIDASTGTVNIDSFLNPNNNEVYVQESYTFNGNTLSVNLETNYTTSGGDPIKRIFTFNGTYDEGTDTFTGNFTYDWNNLNDGSFDKDCEGTMTLTR